MKNTTPRTLVRRLALVVLVVASSSGCRGMQIRQLERELEQLESRVSHLEGRMAASPQR